MTLVRFAARNSAVRFADVDVSSREWTYPALTRDYGEARIIIPRDASILQTDSIHNDAGTFVWIDHPHLPQWRGIQEGKLQQVPNGWELRCREIGMLFQFHDTGRFLASIPLEAGHLLDRAYRTLPATITRIIRPGVFTIAPPLIVDYDPSGLPFSRLLTDLQDRSGQEWRIEPGTDGGLVLNWTPPKRDVYAPVLMEGRDVEFLDRTPDSSTLVYRVIARGPENDVSGLWPAEEATAAELAGEPVAQTVTIDTEYTTQIQLLRAAEEYLAPRRLPNIRYTLGLPQLRTRSSAITVDDPGSSGEGGGPFPLMGGSFNLMGGGFVLYGGGGGSGETTITTPVVSAPTWAIKPGDVIVAILPSAGKTGETIAARVLRVTFDERGERPYPILEVQQLAAIDPAQLAANRYRVPTALPRTITPVQTLAAARTLTLSLPSGSLF